MKKTITIVTPAYNEEKIIEQNITKLHNFFRSNVKNYKWKIVIAEHRSKDKTLEKAKKLSEKFRRVTYIHTDEISKSSAIRNAWLKNKADILMYTDIDLSTNLNHLIELINLISKGYDIAIASRNIKKSKTTRDLRREVLSRVYNFLIKIFFDVKLTDFQCGFKAINRKVLEKLIPKMLFMEEGFMDTELLIVASIKGYKTKEIAVVWEDTRKSKFNIAKVTLNFFLNLLRLKKAILQGRYN